VAWRNVGVCLHETIGTDKRAVANDAPVHDNTVHSYESAASDMAPVEDRAVTNMTVILDQNFSTWKTVKDAAVLHIRSVPDGYPTEIPAQARQRTHVTPWADDDVSNQYC